MMIILLCNMFFFFNDTATTEIYTLSLHDALPISARWSWMFRRRAQPATVRRVPALGRFHRRRPARRSEEHTSELQSQSNLVCRLLLEKKKKHNTTLVPPHTTHRTTPPLQLQPHTE